MATLAVLLTCFNRRDNTLACLQALGRARRPPHVDLTVYLVDDGSRDGTAEAVRQAFPEVRLLQGDGTLYWNGGMRKAFSAAMQDDPDDYLWLNDDTVLDPDALMRLWACRLALSVSSPGPSLIVGATRDPQTGILTYGGLVRRDRRSPYHLVNLPAGQEPQRCRSLNGNCVLVPAAVARTLGNLDPGFTHALGDFDYGLRADDAGFGVWMAPGFVGTCPRNAALVLSPEVARSVRRRLQHACSVKQVPPKAWWIYTRRHCGFFWPLLFVRPYVSAAWRAVQARWAS